MSKNADPGKGEPRSGGQAPRTGTPALKLGLIGDNIAHSKAPLLHSLAGKLAGRDVSYERLVPRALGADFEATFERCATGGYRGVNVTYPYKELAARRVRIDDPLVQAMGAVNTVIFEPAEPAGIFEPAEPPGIFEPGGARGFNTDYSGFTAAYRHARGESRAGRVCMIGAGGVGKAVAFALLNLGLDALWIVDRDYAKAVDLESRLRAVASGLPVTLSNDATALPTELDGLINCTPVGMVGHEGTPLPRDRMRGAGWAFDAVYTPLETQFLKDAIAEGFAVISGYELFFHQGVDAWQLFADCPVDPVQLRRLLSEAGAGPES